jgi:hypothetical protein
MATVPNQCTATSKRSGLRCRRPSRLGQHVCHQHGGATRLATEKGRRVIALQRIGERVAALGLDLAEVNPVEAMLAQLRRAVAVERLLAAELAVHDRLTTFSPVRGEQPAALWTMWRDEADRIVHFSKLLTDAGVEERRIQLEEAELRRVLDAVLAAVADPEWGLSPTQRDLAPRLLAKAFQAAVAGTAAVDAADGSAGANARRRAHSRQLSTVDRRDSAAIKTATQAELGLQPATPADE